MGGEHRRRIGNIDFRGWHDRSWTTADIVSRVPLTKQKGIKMYSVGVTRALCADERLMLRACSLTLALASRNEELAEVVKRKRVKLREIEGLGVDIA